jgi:hypothetical protein
LNSKWRKGIAIVEIVGGISGLLSMGYVVWKLLGDSKFSMMFLLFFVFIMLDLVSIEAGCLLWKNRYVGYWLSVIIQVLQIPMVSCASFLYKFICGLQFGVGIGESTVRMLFFIGNQSQMSIFENDPFYIGINIVPIIFLWILYNSDVISEKYSV